MNNYNAKKYGTDNTPFFILGCVRSGTTMLRDFLRLHPRLECPEETHFFRWADPFGSPRYDRNYITTKIFQNHRRLDTISNMDFHEARYQAKDRREMADAYGRLYLEAKKNRNGRWFDKTPQNIYGLSLLSHMYPDGKFVHIHRNPLNVVASLIEGRVMAKHSVKGGVNYWMEAMIIISEYKKIGNERIIEIPYEEITNNPADSLSRLCEFIDEDFSKLEMSSVRVHPEQNLYKKILTAEEVDYVIKSTQPFGVQYGYG